MSNDDSDDGHLAGVSGAHHDIRPLHRLLTILTGPLLEGEPPDPNLADLGGLGDAHPHTVAGQPQLGQDVHLIMMMMIIKVMTRPGVNKVKPKGWFKYLFNIISFWNSKLLNDSMDKKDKRKNSTKCVPRSSVSSGMILQVTCQPPSPD